MCIQVILLYFTCSPQQAEEPSEEAWFIGDRIHAV